MASQTKTFTYGGTDSSVSKYYKTVLTLTEDTTSVSGNYSTVKYALVLYAGSTGVSSYRTGARITLNGTVYAHRDGSADANKLTISAWGQATLLEGSVNVPHGADGTLSMSVSFEVYHPFTPDSYAPGDFTYSGGTMDLTRIPRHSSLTAASGNIGESISLTVTKQSTSFYHSLRYKHPVSGAYYYIDANGSSVVDETLLSATPVPFKIPVSFADSLAGKTTGSVKVECWTYTENDKSKWLQGSKDASVTFYPLPSVIASSAGVIGATAYITVTKQSANFYHSLRYKHPVSGAYYYINANGSSVAGETLLSATSVPFKVPNLYSVIPSSTSGELKVECWTYPSNDKSVYLTEYSTAVFTYKTDDAQCAPSVSATLKDTNSTVVSITGDSSILVRYVSTAQIAITAEAKNSAIITDPSKDVSLEYRGVWHYDQDLTFDIGNVEQETFRIWARDSRGYEKYGSVSAKSFVPYVPLTNNAYARRENQTGSSVTLYFAGNYYAGQFNGTPNVLRLWYRFAGQSGWTEITENTENVSWVIDEGNHTYLVEIPFDGLEYTSSFSVETCARDLLGEKNSSYDLYKTITIPAGKPVFDWGKEDFRFNVPVEMPALTIDGVSLKDYIKSIIQGG